MSNHFYVFGLLPLVFLLSIHVHAFCYFPDGTLAVGDTPCDPREPHSMCCATEDICLSDHLCFVTSQNRLRRHSCTDASWASGSCAQICTGPGDGDNSTWADIMPCPGSLPGSWFCGYQNVARCTAPEQKTFGLPSGYFADFRNSTPSTSSSFPTQTTFLATTTVTSIATLSGSAGLAVTTSCPNPAGTEVCLSDSAMETRIGVGVGTPLLVGLIGALSLFFRERRLRKNPIAKGSNGLKKWPFGQEELEASFHHPQEADSAPKRTYFEAPT